MTTTEGQIEEQFIEKLNSLKYDCRAGPMPNARQKFEALNRVKLFLV